MDPKAEHLPEEDEDEDDLRPKQGDEPAPAASDAPLVLRSGPVGFVRGFASTFGNTDLTNDIIHPGAFLRSISENPSVPVFWEHEHVGGFFGGGETLPIGQTSRLFETDFGLFFEAPIADTNRGRDVAALLDQGVLGKSSIGFDIPGEDGAIRFDEEGIRHLNLIKLLEISVVTWPANTEASVSGGLEPVDVPVEAEVFASQFNSFLARRAAQIAVGTPEVNEFMRQFDQFMGSRALGG